MTDSKPVPSDSATREIEGADSVGLGVQSRERGTFGTQARHPEAFAYLAFVDGLRAISILAVVGYHVGVPGFSGGFIGVDIFFVISGFLICNQIKVGLEEDRFSIYSFYGRRVVRILPAFLLMLFVVYAVAPFILPSPAGSLDFVLSAVISPVMLTNVLFFLRQGYFDFEADQKPLLHTWTLSVEEQFYLIAPILLVLIFTLGKRRFGTTAFVIAITIGALSLAGAIIETSDTGRNPAFYLPQWRAWEFVAGALISAPIVAAISRAPRALTEAIGMIGVATIIAATTMLESRMSYPSWRAILPVAGASLTILAGVAQPQIIAARILASRGFVAIGLISYSWYLWHWPILSFLRISRLGETSLITDLLAGGGIAFVVAWLSYRYVELPIRRWRPSFGDTKRSHRIVTRGVASCLVVALLGGASGLLGYLWINSYVASRYGTEGQGVLDNDCHIVTGSTIPDHCLTERYGILLGDSHADTLFGSFAKHFAARGVLLVGIARGGCNPILFAPSQRIHNRSHGCANLLDPFERALSASTPPEFVIVTLASASPNAVSTDYFSELAAQFDPRRTRILFIGPVPIFPASSLDCVVLSDRFRQNRDRCVRPRADVEHDFAALTNMLNTAAERFDNVRYINPISLFCGQQTCRPFSGDKVFYWDRDHVLPQGADRIYDGFADEFRWLTGGR